MYVGYFREIPYLELRKLYIYIKDDVNLVQIYYKYSSRIYAN
jgi:hypothetical protein